MLINDGKLDALVKKAMAAFNTLSPEEQRAHRREQSISWAVEQSLMSRFEHGKPDLTPEEEMDLRQRVADAYDHRRAEQKDIDEP